MISNTLMNQSISVLCVCNYDDVIMYTCTDDVIRCTDDVIMCSILILANTEALVIEIESLEFKFCFVNFFLHSLHKR